MTSACISWNVFYLSALQLIQSISYFCLSGQFLRCAIITKYSGLQRQIHHSDVITGSLRGRITARAGVPLGLYFSLRTSCIYEGTRRLPDCHTQCALDQSTSACRRESSYSIIWASAQVRYGFLHDDYHSTAPFTEKRELSWCQLYRNWWHWRLSLWYQPMSLPLMTKLVSLRISVFRVTTQSFSPNTHKRHLFSCPWGQHMGCILWGQRRTYASPLRIAVLSVAS